MMDDRPMTRWHKVGFGVIALSVLGFALTYYRADSVSQPQAAQTAPVPVVTASVQQQNVPLILTGLGTVQALNTATIRSQVTGILERIDFTEGQMVKRGDVLAQIDPR